MQETQETWVLSLGLEDHLEEENGNHFSILAWKIPRTEKPGGLQPKGSQRVRHDQTTMKECKYGSALVGQIQGTFSVQARTCQNQETTKLCHTMEHLCLGFVFPS